MSSAASSLNNRLEKKHAQSQPLRSNRFDERPSIFRAKLLSEELSVNTIMKHSDSGYNKPEHTC